MPVSSLLMSSLMSGGGGGNSGAGQGIANIAGGLVSGVTGFFQRRKAKKLLKEAGEQPLYTIPNEILQNQKRAQMAAAEGLPSQQYNQAMQNIQRQQTRALAASADRRGGLMALPGIQQQANDALLNLDVKDAQARMGNQQRLYGINSQVANYRDKEWEVNKLQPWQRKYSYAQSLLGAGNQNLTGGIDKLLGGAGQLAFQGGGTRRMKAGETGAPSYYNGYNDSSNFSGFETGF